MKHHRRSFSFSPRRRERGVTLIVALVMLLALSMLAVWAYNSSTANLRIVGNTQVRQEALAAAQAAVEKTISSPLFVQQAEAVSATPVGVDIDGNGTNDFGVRLSPKPACYRVRVIKVGELDPGSPADLNCLGSSSAQNSGIEVEGAAAPTGDSLCADSEWNIRAEVTDAQSNAYVAVNQGVGIRSLSTDTANSCP
jgi:PilX N-terminal